MRNFALLLLLIPILGCQRDDLTHPNLTRTDSGWELKLPEGFPQPDIPASNPMHPNKVELGKRLFFEKQLSRTQELSCGTCHQPALAFTGGVAINPGVEDRIGIRNAPTLSNAAYLEAFMFDGGPKNLENQGMLPFDDHNEFDFNLIHATERIREDSTYAGLFENAFGKPLEPKLILMAMAAYERTLLSGNSPYDQYLNSGKTEGLSESALKGLELFESDRLQCSNCHTGLFFTNHNFETNGLYRAGQDSGRMRVTLEESDRGLFKVPTLRNLRYSAPYFHDGRFWTLEEVLDFYSEEGMVHRGDSTRGLHLTEGEKQDLMAFLMSLSDSSFVQDHLKDGTP
ncbi:c-type cytochrome [bacterium SCSIO 12741]|nr:c-type cytochrome [bacterium SCSIO 12741]